MPTLAPPPPTVRSARKPLTEVQQNLAMKYLPLARSLAKPYKLAWPTHRDDFESAACCALCEAAGTFDPERGVKFSTFIHHRVWGAMRDVQRSLVALGWRCDPAHAPLLTTLPKDPEGKGRVIGADAMDPVGSDVDETDSIESMLRALPARHANICRLIYIERMTQHQAADIVGCSQSRLSFLHREAMAILNGTWAERVLGTPSERAPDTEVTSCSC